MPITKTTDLATLVNAKYESDYQLYAIDNPGAWGQFVDWKLKFGQNGGGASSYIFPVLGEFDPAETALDEEGDPDAEVLHDDGVILTPAEWGKRVSVTKRARYQSSIDLVKGMGELVSRNRMNSIDRVLRRTICGRGSTYPTQTMHVDGSVAMADLAVGDVVTYAYLQYLAAYAFDAGIEPFNTGGFRSVVSPYLAMEIQNTTEYKATAEYQDKEKIYGSQSRPFTYCGITFIPSRSARTYQGAGTAIRTASTLANAYSAGATTIVTDDDRSYAVGDVVVLGTLETESVSPGTNRESVRVTSVSTVTLGVRGMGKGEGFGLRFDHAKGEAVSVAADVAAIPIIGKNSIIGGYGADTGEYGEPIVRGLEKGSGRDFLGRVVEWGWYWYGGLAVFQKHLILGKVALTAANRMVGYN